MGDTTTREADLQSSDLRRVRAAAEELAKQGKVAPLAAAFREGVEAGPRAVLLRALEAVPGAEAEEVFWRVLPNEKMRPQLFVEALAALASRRGWTEEAAELRRLDAESFTPTRRAIRLLGRLGDPRALGVFLPLLRDHKSGEDSDRRELVQALGQLGPAALDALLLCLEDGDKAVRSEAIRSLVTLGPSTVPRLLAVLEGNESEDARKAAIGALVGLGEPQVIAPLLAMIAEQTDFAAEQLLGLGTPGLEALAAAPLDEYLQGKVAEKVAEQGERWRQDLERMVRPEHPATRALAVRALALIDGDGAEELLLSLMDDPSQKPAQARRAALLAWTEFDTDTAPPRLLQALDDPDGEVRSYAVSQLTYDPNLVPALGRLLVDPSLEVQLAVIEVIEILRRKELVPQLQALRETGAPAVRRAIDQALDVIASP